MKVLAFGDSIAAGQFVAPELAWPSLLGIEARGVPGDTTRMALERFPRDVQDSGASVVVIGFGHNDANRWQTDGGLPRVSRAAFEANIAEMVSRARVFGIRPILCTLTPTRRNGIYAQTVAEYSAALSLVAGEMKVELVDVRRRFADCDPLLLVDGLHLSPAGHQVYADTVAEVLG